ncbi:hypothetical protein FPV67DRAFT_992769 [Lyophyllum atratum]|nr:hypothetical protein FPV67DRAFT_992769 [Lyophyllum atratum]
MVCIIRVAILAPPNTAWLPYHKTHSAADLRARTLGPIHSIHNIDGLNFALSVLRYWRRLSRTRRDYGIPVLCNLASVRQTRLGCLITKLEALQICALGPLGPYTRSTTLMVCTVRFAILAPPKPYATRLWKYSYSVTWHLYGKHGLADLSQNSQRCRSARSDPWAHTVGPQQNHHCPGKARPTRRTMNHSHVSYDPERCSKARTLTNGRHRARCRAQLELSWSYQIIMIHRHRRDGRPV